MTEIYLMRHSEPLKVIDINNSDSLQIKNEKWPLTIEGEVLAKEKSQKGVLKNFDYVISSNYVRAISTAKYFTDNDIYIDEAFGERKHGINRFKDLPENFEKKQFQDFNYKMEHGESLNEVINRQMNSLKYVLNKGKDKKILIVGHATSFTSLFTKWCDVIPESDYKFNNKVFFDGKWNYCETFKLIFNDENELIDIVNIK